MAPITVSDGVSQASANTTKDNLVNGVNRLAENRSDEDLENLKSFLDANPSVRFLRLEWLDINSINHARIIHTNTAYNMLRERRMISISPRLTHVLHDDHTAPGILCTEELRLFPEVRSLRRAARESYATLRCEYRRKDGREMLLCPRTMLRRIQEDADKRSLDILIGFEIEVVFMTPVELEGRAHYVKTTMDVQGHQYSSTRAVHSSRILSVVESIVDALTAADIPLEQWHPESSVGQWEFVLAPSSPLHAVDTLIAARDIIADVTAQRSLRATLYPKPHREGWMGTGAHVHISIKPPTNQQQFYAGILKHLRAIVAFTCPNPMSYERAVESGSSGGSWVSWGTLNRDTPLRRVEGSHYEIKCIDEFANMYLTMGAIIGAGLRGIANREVSPTQDCQRHPAELSDEERRALGITQKMPSSIEEALKCLEEDVELRGILGEELVEAYLSVKYADNALFSSMDSERLRDFLIERH